MLDFAFFSVFQQVWQPIFTKITDSDVVFLYTNYLGEVKSYQSGWYPATYNPFEYHSPQLLTDPKNSRNFDTFWDISESGEQPGEKAGRFQMPPGPISNFQEDTRLESTEKLTSPQL